MQFSLASLFVVTTAAGVFVAAARVVATVAADLSPSRGDSFSFAGLALFACVMAAALAAVFSDS